MHMQTYMYTPISADVELQMLKQYFVNIVDGESQDGPTVAIDLELDISLYFSIRILWHTPYSCHTRVWGAQTCPY